MVRIRGIAALLGVVVAALSGATAALSPFPLIGTVWAWHAVARDGGARDGIAAPERYTIELAADGTMNVRADCNRGKGRYQGNDVELRFGPIAATKVGCPAGSRDREFLESLSRVDAYRFEGIELVLATAGSRDTLRFKPAQR